ncbi:unnamed protein product [Miscanthus lutarioriparius]|uniref:Uncharacterized protein n=1 Tax=Miscanthus lutarioriparius TaxID=422564 RepID=A0A811SEB6_9POAL|nr:unnamed protein product [Miscanthus lutarioriparius]
MSSESHLCMDYSRAINELVASMTRELVYWRSHGIIDDHGTKCTLIYKVLEHIRASDPNAYEPRVLSIGPYHHSIPSLLPMEKEKWMCLDYVLKLNPSRSLHDYLAVISALEREARMCSAEDDIIIGTTFVEMLLLDACFILVCLNGIGAIRLQADMHGKYSYERDKLTELLVGQNKSITNDSETMSGMPNLSCTTNDDFVLQMNALQMEENRVDSHQENIHGNIVGQDQENLEMGEQWYNSSAVYDLLLLENQIPFFVVTKIYELLVDDESITPRLLTDNLARFIEGILVHFPLSIQDTNRPRDFDHLLHLCYMYFKPTHRMQDNHKMKKTAGYIYNLLCSGFKAEEYHEAGVEFTERIFDEHEPHSLLDIEFRNGLLHIPCLPIDDKSGTVFRNLLAFEQTCPSVGNDLASYVYFMSQLISVPDDVALLSRKGVIVDQLESDKDVSSLFAELFENIDFNFSGFTALASVVMVFCSIGQTILAFLSYMSKS